MLVDSSLYFLIVLFSLLVNDTPIGFYSNSRGLRQGDPLSPMLFVFVMEALGRMISVAVNGELMDAFLVGNLPFLIFSL